MALPKKQAPSRTVKVTKKVVQAAPPTPKRSKANPATMPTVLSRTTRKHATDDPYRLRPSDIEGVYVNRMGVLVDADGIMISLARAREIEEERFGDTTPSTPAELLKAAALNQRLPLEVRLDAAGKAAPYFDRKVPVGIEGSMPGSPINLTTLRKGLKNLTPQELETLIALLAKAGIDEGDDESTDS